MLRSAKAVALERRRLLARGAARRTPRALISRPPRLVDPRDRVCQDPRVDCENGHRHPEQQTPDTEQVLAEHQDGQHQDRM